MPPRVPAELDLEAPEYEEDIGDLSPYINFPSSTSSRASSSTVSSSLAESHPRNIYTDDEDLDQDIPLANDLSPVSAETPKKSNFSLPLPSPSSPSLVPKRPSQFLRSQTLPRGFVLEKERIPRRIQTEINALPVDPVSVAKMQRWILGIAVGELISFLYIFHI